MKFQITMETIFHIFIISVMVMEPNVEARKLKTTLIENYCGPLDKAESFDAGSIENLIIRKSNITVEPSLKMPKLKYLTVESSRWKGLGNRIKDCCKQLEKLELQFNEFITTEELKAIGSLQIKSLWISQSSIPSLEENVLRNENLKELILIYDLIMCVDDNAFTQIPNLEKLFLCGNHLTSIPTKALAPLKNLKALAVVDNEIKDLQGKDFGYLPNLEVLVISRNPLKVINLSGIEELAPKLKSVYISNEETVVIEDPSSPKIVSNKSISFFEILAL